MANILLTDDDASIRQFIKGALERAGHKITVCADGLEALKALENQETFYDLLLTDVVMPGIDGLELSKKAAELRPDMKIIMITGFAAMAMNKAQPGPAPLRIISKPFHLGSLIREVEEILRT